MAICVPNIIRIPLTSRKIEIILILELQRWTGPSGSSIPASLQEAQLGKSNSQPTTEQSSSYFASCHVFKLMTSILKKKQMFSTGISILNHAFLFLLQWSSHWFLQTKQQCSASCNLQEFRRPSNVFPYPNQLISWTIIFHLYSSS